MADLFQIGVGTVNHHLKAIFAEGELQAAATIRRYRIVQDEGVRQIAREVEHYHLDAIVAVAFRVGRQRKASRRLTSMNTKRANKLLHPTTIPLTLHGGG